MFMKRVKIIATLGSVTFAAGAYSGAAVYRYVDAPVTAVASIQPYEKRDLERFVRTLQRECNSARKAGRACYVNR